MKRVKRDYSSIVGQSFGHLKVISVYYSVGEKKWMANVVCECGGQKTVRAGNLCSGNTKACGCNLFNKRPAGYHGGHDHPLYIVWLGMRARCYKKNNDNYQYYGGRGIRVCKEWKSGFLPFFTWALKNGWAKGLEIDRIDTDGDYTPNNCQFVTQGRNKRTRRCAVRVLYRGELVLLLDLADRIGMNYKTIKTRYHRGWPVERIINEPLRKWA